MRREDTISYVIGQAADLIPPPAIDPNAKPGALVAYALDAVLARKVTDARKASDYLDAIYHALACYYGGGKHSDAFYAASAEWDTAKWRTYLRDCATARVGDDRWLGWK